MILTTEERVWLVEHVLREGDRYTDVMDSGLLKNSQINLFHIATQFVILLISSQVSLSEKLIALFRNKIRILACIDAKGGHFKHTVIYNCHSYLLPVFYI